MAAIEITSVLAEVISTLEPSKIPDKLHCPICDKFLINGYKLSCCDQTICEPCSVNISDHCPLCDHEPFTQELCKPNKPLRTTAKAFLKTQEKKLADERAKAAAAATVAESPAPDTPVNDAAVSASAPSATLIDGDQKEEPAAASELPGPDEPQPSIEAYDNVFETEVTEAKQVEKQGRLTREDAEATEVPTAAFGTSQDLNTQDPTGEEIVGARDASEKDATNAFNMANFPNMMNLGFNMMDPQAMMNFMNGNGMNGFNPMMAMSNMGMNSIPQGLFGGFGGPGMGMNGTNGMNMNMNFNPNSGMYGTGFNGQNNNMWNGVQNNNPNAFSNGIGGDFGSNSGYGYNMSQPGHFHQQYPNGDFGYNGRGHGRGRGRGRGFRARGNNNQFSQANQPHFQNAHEQQQYEIQSMQSRMMNVQPTQATGSGHNKADEHVETQDDDDFAPGGQEEVQEALGEDYHKSQAEEVKEEQIAVESVTNDHAEGLAPEAPIENADTSVTVLDGESESMLSARVQSPAIYGENTAVAEDSPPKEVSREQPNTAMPPPSAPLGPSAQFREPEDYGFKARGNNKYPSRGRGSFSAQNGPPVSPIRAPPQVSAVSPPEPKGVGVVGAPTGPKAMREPPSRSSRPPSTSISNGGGFKIMGRASMNPHTNQGGAADRSKSDTPVDVTNNNRDSSRSPSRHRSRHSRHDTSRHEANGQDDYDRDHDRDRRRRKSRRDDDYDMQDAAERPRSRSVTPDDRKSSHRSRRDKDRHVSSSKHHSSRSRRHRDEADGGGDHEMDDYGVPADADGRGGHHGHRSSKSSRYDDRDRERERDREGRYRERKRVRHDRDRDDAGEAEDESRHRSRRHKRDHRDEPATNGSVNGNGTGSRSHRTSGAATPSEQSLDKAVDPHTLEREARNKERMEKEQQRREKALRGDGGKGQDLGRRGLGNSSRRVSYKYEDDLASAMVEGEREVARWR